MALDREQLKSNISMAFLAQGFAFATSLLMSFFVPKVLGVTEFGYWQLFIFYSNYASLSQLGLNDGIYLVNGDKTDEELDLPGIRSMFRVNLIMQLVIANVFFLVTSGFTPDMNRIEVLLFFSIYIVMFNVTYFIGFVLQATNRVKQYSVSQILDRVCFLAPLLVLLVLQIKTFEPYIIAFLTGRVVSLFYCVFFGRKYVVGDTLKSIIRSASVAFDYLRVGIKLTISNMASLLVLGAFRFFVDGVWDIETFGQFSLALSLVSFFLAFIQQVSMVLFPALRRLEQQELAGFSRKVSELLGCMMPLVYLLYPLICFIIGAWLPDYDLALWLLGILLPVCLFESRMSILGTTLFKVLRREKTLMVVNVASVGISVVLSAIGSFALASVDALCVFAVIVVAIRCLISETILTKELGYINYPMLVGEVALAAAFMAANMLLEGSLALVVIGCVLLIYIVLFRREYAAMAGLLARNARKSA